MGEGVDPGKSLLHQHHQSFTGIKYTLPREYKTVSKTNRDTVEINLSLQFPVFLLFVLQQDDEFLQPLGQPGCLRSFDIALGYSFRFPRNT